MENLLISAAINDRKFYEQVREHLDGDRDFGPIAGDIWTRIRGFYDRDAEAAQCSRDAIREHIRATVSKDKVATSLIGYIDGLPESSVPNTVDLLVNSKRNAIGQRLAIALANREPATVVAPLMEEYQKWLNFSDADSLKSSANNSVIDFARFSVRDLVVRSYDDAKLIRLWPTSLNDRIDGGLRPGHHVVIFAHTEVGKTLLALNMVAGFVRQQLKVLYCGNEDPVSDIALRSIIRLSGKTKHEIIADPDEADRIAVARGKHLLTLADLAPGTFRQISTLVDDVQPQVVILDQLRNIAIKRDGTRADNLEQLGIAARNLAKDKGVVVISLTQAGITALNKLVIEISDMDSSKTGIPGTADLIIGIGANDTSRRAGIRTLNLCKNKLSGKHEFFEVAVDEQLGTVKSI